MIRSSKQGAPIIGVRYSQCQWKHWVFTAKAIADKIDYGEIVLPVTDTDLKNLEGILSKGDIPVPNLVHHIYKNRRNKYKSVKLWCSADLGICRVTPIFMTTNNYELIPLKEDFNIEVKPRG